MWQTKRVYGPMPNTKQCKKCGKTKPRKAYGMLTVGGKTYLQSYCMPCRYQYNKKRGKELTKIKHMEQLARGEIPYGSDTTLKVHVNSWRTTIRYKTEYKFDAKYYTINRLVNMLASQPDCAICKTRLNLTDRSSVYTPMLCRINPEKGYVKGNTVITCYWCYHIKGKATAAELRMIASFMRRNGAP